MYDLTKKMLNRDTSDVPIGAPVITNNPNRNSPEIKRITTRTPVTKVNLEHVAAIGYEYTQVERDTNKNEMEFAEIQDPNILRSVDWAFDDSTGTLKFVRRNKDVVEIHSFLRQADFGVGPQGPRGEAGFDGEDGEDGEEGEDGETGCAGLPGPEGRQGEVGDRGLEGPIGLTGPAGPRGERGPRGPQGPEGLIGFAGTRGPCGFGCSADLTGPEGPVGITLKKEVCTEPSPTFDCVLWAAPVDCLCPDDSHEVTYIPIPKPRIMSQRILESEPLICKNGQTISGIWMGPVTASGTYVETIWSDGSVETSEPDYNGAYCAMPVMPPPVVECRYEHDMTYVYQTRRRKKNDNNPYYHFVINGIEVHQTRYGSKNGSYKFREGNPITTSDGRKFWMGELKRNESGGSAYRLWYEICGEFEG